MRLKIGMKINQLFLPFFFVFIFCSLVKSQDQKTSGYLEDKKEAYINNSAEKSLKWFRKAKFGMFIHWGLYSKIAGEWDGERYYGIGEWVMKRAEVPVKEYEQVASTFNPVNFNAEEWVQLAKEAGMRYIIITAKHHDGFAMFRSQVSDFNIVDATPFKRDPLKELARACRKYGIKLGFYYSQTQDWHEPNAVGNDWDFDPRDKDFDVYLKKKVRPQLEELLKNYGPLGIIWFDTPGDITPEESRALVDWVHSLQPEVMISSRVGNDMGDYLALQDHQLPDSVIKRPFEALFTHNDSWGYTLFDKNYRSPRDIIILLVESNSKGGNFLFNIGPKGNGSIPDESRNMLREVGEWIDRNQEAIYGSSYSPFPDLTWGYCTSKPGSYYFHVFDWPENGYLRIPDIAEYVEQVKVLASSTPLDYRKEGSDLLVDIPLKVPDPLNTVIKVQYKGEVKHASFQTLMENYTAKLTPGEANFSGDANKRQIRWMEEFGDWKYVTIIEEWNTADDKASWSFRVVEPNTYRVVLRYSYPDAKQPPEGIIRFKDQELYFQAHQTGTESHHFQDHQIGIIHMNEPGVKKLSVNPF